MRWRAHSPLPFFGLSFTITILALGALVLAPLAMMILGAKGLSFANTIAIVREPTVLSALTLSLVCALLSAATNALLGMLLAWVLARYNFWGKRILNALIDLPFALPSAVMGISLATLYAPNGLLGAPLQTLGIKVAFTPLGIYLALVVVGMPFVVRALLPVLQQMPKSYEEAAATMGATSGQIFCKVIIPNLMPAWITGTTMAFARAVGEYGSVIFIAGNVPMQSQILPLIIMGKLEQFDIQGASVVALCMLLISLIVMAFLGAWQWSLARKLGGAR